MGDDASEEYFSTEIEGLEEATKPGRDPAAGW